MKGARANTSTQLVCICLSSQKLNDAIFSFYWQTSDTNVQLADSSFTNFSLSPTFTVCQHPNFKYCYIYYTSFICHINSGEKNYTFYIYLQKSSLKNHQSILKAAGRSQFNFQHSHTDKKDFHF